MDMRRVTITSNVKYYLDAKMTRYNVLWRYKTKLQFQYRDQWLDSEHFDIYYPKVEFRRYPKNPNKGYIL